jgi:hypothetical protein
VAGGFFAASLLIFGAQLRFDLSANPSFKLSTLAFFTFLFVTLGILRAELCLDCCLALRFFLCLEPGGFFSLSTRVGFGPSLCFLFGTTSSLFSSQPLGFFLCAPASFFFGNASRILFLTAAGRGFGPQLSLNLGAQARFFFRLKARAEFRLPAHFRFYPATFGLFDQSLRVGLSLHTHRFARLDPFDFFLDGSESHFGATA